MQKSSDKNIDLTMSVRKDHNCAQAAAYGILTYFGYDSEAITLAKSFVPFGGGVGEGSICGAVLGSLAGLSRILNYKNMSYRDIVETGKKFKQLAGKQFDTYICKELLKEFTNNKHLTEEMKTKKDQICTDIIKFSVDTARLLIEDSS